MNWLRTVILPKCFWNFPYLRYQRFCPWFCPYPHLRNRVCTSRLSNESELAVIQATGMSPWRLARPVFMFGLLTAALMFGLTAYLVPKTGTITKDREFELSQSLGAKFLREGSFQHPVKASLFIREITPDSELRDVFLSDRREKDASYTYTSERAFLVQTEDQTIFVMQNGLMQSHDRTNDTLSLTQFDELAYDLTGTFDATRKGRPHIYYLPTMLLWTDPQLAADLTRQPMSRVIEDKHRRIQFAALCLVSSEIGYAALYAAGFSRFGSGRFIALAIFLLVIVKLVESVVTEPARPILTYGTWSTHLCRWFGHVLGINVSFDQPKFIAQTK